jgi:hypothetical protein
VEARTAEQRTGQVRCLRTIYSPSVRLPWQCQICRHLPAAAKPVGKSAIGQPQLPPVLGSVDASAVCGPVVQSWCYEPAKKREMLRPQLVSWCVSVVVGACAGASRRCAPQQPTTAEQVGGAGRRAEKFILTRHEVTAR